MKKLLSVITLLASIPICGMKVLLAAYTVLKCIL